MQLGEMLVRAKAITPSDLEEAIGWQVLYGGRLGTNLLELGLVDEKILAETLGRQLACESTYGEIEVSESMAQAIPPVIARRAEVVPWKLEGRKFKVLCIAPADNLAFFDEMGFRLGKLVKPVVAPEFRVHQALRRHFESVRQMRALDFGIKPKGKRQQDAEKKAEQVEAEKAVDLMDDEAFAQIYSEALRGRPVGGTTPEVAQPVAAPPAVSAPIPPPAPAPPPPIVAAAPSVAAPVISPVAPPPGWSGVPVAVPHLPQAGPPPGWRGDSGRPAPRPQPPPTLVPHPVIHPAAPPPIVVSSMTPVVAPAEPIPLVLTPKPKKVAPVVAPAPPPILPPIVATQVAAPTVTPTVITEPELPVLVPAQPTSPILVAASDVPGLELQLEPLPQVDTELIEGELIEGELIEGDGAHHANVAATVTSDQWAAAMHDLEATLAATTPKAAPVRDMSPLSFPVALSYVGKALDRDEVARTVLRYARSKAARAVLLSVQGDVALGWDAIGDSLTQDMARNIAFPLTVPSAFRLVRQSRSHYIGPLGKEPGNVRFLKLAGKQWPASAVLLPVLFRGKVVYILYVDNGHKQHVNADVGELLILSQNISRSMEQMVAAKQAARA